MAYFYTTNDGLELVEVGLQLELELVPHTFKEQEANFVSGGKHGQLLSIEKFEQGTTEIVLDERHQDRVFVQMVSSSLARNLVRVCQDKIPREQL